MGLKNARAGEFRKKWKNRLKMLLWKIGSLSVAWLFAPEIQFVNCLGKALEACAGAEIFLEALDASDQVILVPADGYCGFRRDGCGSP